MCALLVAVETLQQTAGYENYDKFYEGLGMITGIIRNARKHVQARAEQFAETYKDDTVIYTMGSGAGYGAAYMESICILWKCSGLIPAVFIQENISMDRLKSQMQTVRL